MITSFAPVARVRFTLLALLIAATSVFAAVPSTASAQLTVPITGTNITNATFTLQQFAVDTVSGVQQLVAVGTITGTVAGTTAVIPNVRLPVLLPATQARCEILDLSLGPINLNLLGLVIQTNQIDLNIFAVPGPGNLLGNLLCAVAGLLDRTPANLQPLVALLNRLLGVI